MQLLSERLFRSTNATADDDPKASGGRGGDVKATLSQAKL